MTTASVTFTYSVEKHPKLHEWLNDTKVQSNRSKAIRDMLLLGLGQQSDEDILEQILSEIRTIRENGTAIKESSSTPAKVVLDVTPDTAQNLRTLGK